MLTLAIYAAWRRCGACQSEYRDDLHRAVEGRVDEADGTSREWMIKEQRGRIDNFKPEKAAKYLLSATGDIGELLWTG
jgi:hypothetical protein